MSATQSTKRPLETPSSPSANEQPEAKRPALDKIIQSGPDASDVSSNGVESEDAKIDANGVTEEQDDALAPDASVIPVTLPTETAGSDARSSQSSNLPHDESGWIHIRAVITSAEAATVIGKGGENVSVIRKMSGAKCTVSDYQKGAVERILTVSGVVDAAAKVCLLIQQNGASLLTLTRHSVWLFAHSTMSQLTHHQMPNQRHILFVSSSLISSLAP
jgi:heterogeneous nuclear rnp K-like protein 2